MAASALPTRLVTAAELAERLAVSEWWVLAEARAGRLPHFKLGRMVRFGPEEVDAWLAQHHRLAAVPEHPLTTARGRARLAEPPQQLAVPRRRAP